MPSQSWQVREVSVTMPKMLARTMWEEAERRDIYDGGCFEAQMDTIAVWSGPLIPARGRAEALGLIFLRWRAPTAADATIYRMIWNEERITSDGVWAAMESLVGMSLRPLTIAPAVGPSRVATASPLPYPCPPPLPLSEPAVSAVR